MPASILHTLFHTDPDTGEKSRKKRRETDSDSELSAVDHPDMELASSHSSDDDDDDLNYGWNRKKKGTLTECERQEISLCGCSMCGFKRTFVVM